MLTLFASTRGYWSAAVEERELSQIGQSEVGNRGFPVRRFISFLLVLNLTLMTDVW
jgi:hypothetical protein